VAQPYAGTRMHEDFKKAGLLKKGFIKISDSKITKYSTKYFSAEQLNSFRRKTYIKFYLTKMLKYTNPLIFYKEFLSKIRSLEDLKYVLKILKTLAIGFIY
jgi:hypothetical protein